MRGLAYGAACVLMAICAPFAAVTIALGEAISALLDYSTRAEEVRYERAAQ